MKLSLIFNSRFGLTLLCAVVAGANAFADYVVNSTGDQPWYGNRLGLCETAPFNGVCTLRAAIQASNAIGGTSISFNIPTSDPGYTNGTWFIQTFSVLPDITASINITGPGSRILIITSSGDPRLGTRVFNVTTAGTVNMSGLTIANGYTTGGQFGAGIQNVNGATINLTNCTLSNNQSEGATNNGGGGGGIYNASNGTVNVTDCIFRFNRGNADPYVGYGGGIWNKTGTVHVSNSTFDHNQSSYRGGAISNSGGIVTVGGSTFYGNGAAQGGAISGDAGTISVTNSTFFSNVAYAFDQGYGGAIINFNKSVLNISNSTITANVSNYGGSGVYNDNTFGAVANVKSTIIAANVLGTSDSGAAPDVYGAFKSSGFNLIGKNDGSTGFTLATDKKGTVVSPLNPKFDPKGLQSSGGPTQTVALVAGSPAIDKGTSVGLTGTLTNDQRGLARTVDNSGIANANGGDGTDIGACEFGAQ